MPKYQDDILPSIYLCRLKEGTEEPDFTVPLDGPYDVTKYIDAWAAEAGIKGCVLVLTAMLLPSKEFYASLPGLEESEELGNGSE